MADDSKSNGPITATAGEFITYLEKHDLNDANAGRVFGVTPTTVKQWQRDGLTGPAAVLFRLILNTGMTPYLVASQVGIRLSGFGRGLYKRKEINELKGEVGIPTSGDGGAPLSHAAIPSGIPTEETIKNVKPLNNVKPVNIETAPETASMVRGGVASGWGRRGR